MKIKTPTRQYINNVTINNFLVNSLKIYSISFSFDKRGINIADTAPAAKRLFNKSGILSIKIILSASFETSNLYAITNSLIYPLNLPSNIPKLKIKLLINIFFDKKLTFANFYINNQETKLKLQRIMNIKLNLQKIN